jgi:hypothetical protein
MAANARLTLTVSALKGVPPAPTNHSDSTNAVVNVIVKYSAVRASEGRAVR